MSLPLAAGLPPALIQACRRCHVRPTRDVLAVSVRQQQVSWYRLTSPGFVVEGPRYRLYRTFVASTSRFGNGEVRDSQRTPRGLHRVVRKVGAGWPVGTVFQSRHPIGYVWRGLPSAAIAHRILWLGGLEPGFNQGGKNDTFSRYIYIHGLADEPSLGRPTSQGCVHVAAVDLIPLFDRIQTGTLVWITADR